MRNHLHCSTPVLLMLLGPWSVFAAPCPSGTGCACVQCPTGQEPSTPCSEVDSSDVVVVVECRRCPPRTFSDSHGPDQCRKHTQCRSLNRRSVRSGTSHSDTVCGSCRLGFHPAATPGSSTLRSCERTSAERMRRNAVKSGKTSGVASSGALVGGANSTTLRVTEEKKTEYAVFALVPVFCVMGLLGILICNILKKKGYTCTGDKENAQREGGALQKEGNANDGEDENEDTISALVRLITKKKENAAALEELFLEYEKKKTSISKSPSFRFPGFPHLPQLPALPRLCTHHRHLHTINGLAPLTGFGCSRCSQKKWPELLTPLTSDTPKSSCTPPSMPSSPVVGTVHNVGRFQVAQIAEGDAIIFGTSPSESSDSDSVYSAHTDPTEDTALLTTSSSFSQSRHETNA